MPHNDSSYQVSYPDDTQSANAFHRSASPPPSYREATSTTDWSNLHDGRSGIPMTSRREEATQTDLPSDAGNSSDYPSQPEPSHQRSRQTGAYSSTNNTMRYATQADPRRPGYNQSSSTSTDSRCLTSCAKSILCVGTCVGSCLKPFGKVGIAAAMCCMVADEACDCCCGQCKISRQNQSHQGTLSSSNRSSYERSSIAASAVNEVNATHEDNSAVVNVDTDITTPNSRRSSHITIPESVATVISSFDFSDQQGDHRGSNGNREGIQVALDSLRHQSDHSLTLERAFDQLWEGVNGWLKALHDEGDSEDGSVDLSFSYDPYKPLKAIRKKLTEACSSSKRDQESNQ
ncbi:uncharacterized protein L201_002501 [Kwoniella dendrophila CBS 6074]|uniref:Uncharacterized protein n=1 Tax=Kwoniella dendrophila CBS 6074 TaxID=1295534 RepID=A0AAX4JQE2_9TREE